MGQQLLSLYILLALGDRSVLGPQCLLLTPCNPHLRTGLVPLEAQGCLANQDLPWVPVTQVVQVDQWDQVRC